jgi:aminoglycoside phosphotransferase (APT) family kinase protein
MSDTQRPDPIQAARPWLPEVVVDADLATALVRTVAPALAVLPPSPLGAGWDNTAWVFRDASDAWVFRFPRRAIAVRCMEAELAALPALADHLPLAVPRPQWHGAMPNGWPFAGYRLLPGEVLATTPIGTHAEVELAALLGDFLGALHALPVALAPALAPDPLGRLDVDRREAVTLASLAASGSPSAAAVPLIAAAREAATTHATRSVISHGDLDLRHVLVDAATSRVSGVIDWGDLMLADPAIDLGLAFSAFDGHARATFLEAYAARTWPVSATTLTLARFRALTTSARILTWALDIGDAALTHYARAALGRVLA